MAVLRQVNHPMEINRYNRGFVSSMSKTKIANDQNEQGSLQGKIETQNQKSKKLKERIALLQERKKMLAEQNLEKKLRLQSMKDDIRRWKVEQDPLVKQLREHYKALKEEMGDLMDDDDSEDEVDIDNMTYEELLELGDKIGHVSKGLSPNKFSKLQRVSPPSEEQCRICLDDFEGQQCLKLPCGHIFHEECLKKWCSGQKVCPNCKTEIA